ncbi:hypothetical protein E2C01_044801 [Portunus trituberculatus]|uniref:Uncharacterized protein n=1 Tax=Portunus trituberculatus TaxID=210409 RepID=A0A5B7FZB8_PORTR|nr:hypothetical protein [Portunus trituberculatus]
MVQVLTPCFKARQGDKAETPSFEEIRFTTLARDERENKSRDGARGNKENAASSTENSCEPKSNPQPLEREMCLLPQSHAGRAQPREGGVSQELDGLDGFTV